MKDENQKRRAELLRADMRAVVHLRAQHDRRRLGLIFGSGIGRDLNFPDWDTLVKNLAKHSDVDAATILEQLHDRANRSLSSVTQLLFNRYRAKRVEKLSVASLDFLEEQRIKSDWLALLHHELHAGETAESRRELLKAHPYLNSFLEIIKLSKLTVNYNFDDTLEKMLAASRTNSDSNSRGYETIAQPNAQFRRDDSIIYHPNGYLPSRFTEGASADVVFAEDAFQDQLIHAATGRYVHLSNHLMANTCLLVGLSLEDATLQSLLRQNAVSNPGNVHYIVNFLDDEGLEPEVRETIFATNYESFNLYTLFLNRQGIADLADLISFDDGAFDLEHPGSSKKFVYYVVGSVGAGKSTAASNFRNLTFDEWVDEKPPELARPESEIPDDKKDPMNDWIADQFRKKNASLARELEGIHLVDRCPLDPLTFPGDRTEKAQRLLDEITDNGHRTIEQGHIIYLDCDVQDVMHRNSLKHKFWTREKFEELMSDIQSVYGNLDVTKICTRGRDREAVAKEIARLIFCGKYSPVNVDGELRKFAQAKPAEKKAESL
jgi:hypothetical protein